MTTQNHEPLDGLDAPALVTAGLVAAIGSFAIIVGLQVMYLRFAAAQAEENQNTSTATSSASLLAEQRSKLNRYGWIDRRNDVVAIPIDLAIELTARELGSQPSEGSSESPERVPVWEPST